MSYFKYEEIEEETTLLSEDYSSSNDEYLTTVLSLGEKFMSAVHTDIGIKKKTNQDSLCLKIANTPTGEIALAVVCDGMGGLKKGELASATIIKAFADWFETELPELLKEGYSTEIVKKQWSLLIEKQNKMLEKYGKDNYLQLGTTLTALLVKGEDMLIAQVGDSRVYRITDSIVQLTEDQTVAQRDIKMGVLKPEDAKRDMRQNVLLQCIGASSIVHPEYIEDKVKTGDVYLLCTDGFRHEISNDELLAFLSSDMLINETVMKKKLVDLVELNKKREEKDNITAILLKIA